MFSFFGEDLKYMIKGGGLMQETGERPQRYGASLAQVAGERCLTQRSNYWPTIKKLEQIFFLNRGEECLKGGRNNEHSSTMKPEI